MADERFHLADSRPLASPPDNSNCTATVSGALIMLFTNQPLLRHGLECLVRDAALGGAIASGTVDSLIETVRHDHPHILLVDFTPEVGVLLLTEIRRASPSTRIIVMAPALSWEMACQLRAIGANGFLRRDCSLQECITAFRRAAEGECRFSDPGDDPVQDGEMVHLSPREGQLVNLLSQGLKNKEMAQCLGISEGTVRVYLSKLYLKMGINDRFELALFGLRNCANLPAVWPQQMKLGAGNSSRVPSLRMMWLRRSRPRLLAMAAGSGKEIL